MQHPQARWRAVGFVDLVAVDLERRDEHSPHIVLIFHHEDSGGWRGVGGIHKFRKKLSL
jgi:hypothetical protein